MILFFNDNEKSKNYQQEKLALRMQIDETMFVEEFGLVKPAKDRRSVKRGHTMKGASGPSLYDEDVERFSIRIGNRPCHIESLRADRWPDAFKHFSFT